MSKNTEPQAKTTLYLPKKLHTRIKVTAATHHLTMTQFVVRAVENELKDMTENHNANTKEL